MEEVEVVVAHSERATLRVGDVFLKIDADQARTDVEVEAMALAPVRTPEILWRKPPVLALAALPGTALGRLGQPSAASAAAWAAAGAAARILHDAPLPPWPGRSLEETVSDLDRECQWLITNDVLPAGLVTRNRRAAEAALRPWTPVFTHGDLQVAHVFVDGDEITGVIDWSDAGHGDALYDLAILTLGHEEHVGDVVAGYGSDVDLDVIRAWWSVRSLQAARWLIEHGFDPSSPGCEFDVLRSQAWRLTGPVLLADGLPDQRDAAGERACWHLDELEPEFAVCLLVESLEGERVPEADLPGWSGLHEALVADEEGQRLVCPLRDYPADFPVEQAGSGEAQVAAEGQGAGRRAVEEDGDVPGLPGGFLPLPLEGDDLVDKVGVMPRLGVAEGLA